MVKPKNKLILINPVEKRHLISKAMVYPPLGLGMLAALTPDHWEIQIMDENHTDFEFKPADLVGITTCTSTVLRAYDIAKIYRQHHIPVVLGGIHASMLPQEALQFANAVVIGEAENIWSEVIRDFENKRLQTIYQGTFSDLKKIVWPRRDLFQPGYQYDSIQTSRGCPHACEFCSVSVFNQKRYRKRPVEDVLDEIETLQKHQLLFVDDNLAGYTPQDKLRCKQLFQGMIDRGIKKDWTCYSTLEMAKDDELLALARKSGCRLVMLGLEAEHHSSLQALNKQPNLKDRHTDYAVFLNDIFRRFHSHDIVVHGNFIFGVDTDTPATLKKRTHFILNSDLDVMSITLLLPLPGTNLFNRLKLENRLLKTNFPSDWLDYHFYHVTLQPLHMSEKMLQEIFIKSVRKIYSRFNLIVKFFKSWRHTGHFSSALWVAFTNHYHRLAYFDYLFSGSKSKKKIV